MIRILAAIFRQLSGVLCRFSTTLRHGRRRAVGIVSSTLRQSRRRAVIVALGVTGCYGDVGVEGVYYPEPAYIATVPPVYYEGRPYYWYRDRWYYRGYGGGWGYYRSEPGFLRPYRGGYVRAPERRYERHEEHREWGRGRR